MNVKYNSEKPKKAKIIKIFNLSSKPIKRHNSLHKIYSSEKENINIINIKNDVKEEKNELKNKELDFIFYKDLTNQSFADDFFSSFDNTFIVFTSINNIIYLIYASAEKSIISYDLKNYQKISEIKSAHDKYITNFRHIYDKKNKRDIIMSVSALDNNLKIWNIYNWDCILELKNVNRTGVLYSSSFLYENENIYIITSNSNLLKRKEPIKIFNMSKEKLYEIKLDYSINFIDCYYENILNQIYIIICTEKNVVSYDYKNKKIYNKYGKEKGSYYSIIVHKSNNNIELIASNFNGIIEIYDFNSGIELTEIKINNSKGFFGICLWDKHNLLVASGDNTIKLINLEKRKLEKCLYGHSNYVTTIKKIYITKFGDCLISQGISSDSIKLWIPKN